MSNFKKDNNLLNGKGEDDVQWITVNGSHIPLKDGESPKEAIKEHFGNKKGTNKVLSLNDQVDSVLNGTFNGSHVVLAEETPKILQEIGVPNKPMLITAKHTYLAINESGKYTKSDDHYHNLGKELFLQIPDLLKSPVLAFQSDSEGKEIIAVVNAIDKNKNPVIVPLKIDGKGTKNFIRIDANIAKSVYGRKNFQDFINKNINKDNLLLVENKKIRSLTN